MQPMVYRNVEYLFCQRIMFVGLYKRSRKVIRIATNTRTGLNDKHSKQQASLCACMLWFCAFIVAFSDLVYVCWWHTHTHIRDQPCRWITSRILKHPWLYRICWKSDKSSLVNYDGHLVNPWIVVWNVCVNMEHPTEGNQLEQELLLHKNDVSSWFNPISRLHFILIHIPFM